MKLYISYLLFTLQAVFLLSFNSSAQGINISSGAWLVAQGNISLVLSNGGIKNDGTFIPGNSTVYFEGAAATAVSGTQPVPFYNVTLKGSGTKLNEGTALVRRTIAVEGTTVFDTDGAANNRSFTLCSSDTLTSNVDILITGNIIGNAVVERFINTGTSAVAHPKSWQFLATPTAGQTIFQAWQEGGLVPPGYGTWITGTGSGFDATTALPSVKFYNPPSNDWTAVSSTSALLQNKQGYMLFVRGDRTVTTYNGAPVPTNMRSKGTLFTPSNPPPSVIVSPNLFQSFGNPYASRISFNQVYNSSTGINDVFYVWDPKLNGSYGLGGYQTISGVTGYIPTAGSATAYYPANVPSPYIESGQAVFVKGNATGGSVNFNENCKASGSRLVHRDGNNGNQYPPERSFLSATLFTHAGNIADGNIVAFENGLGNEINQTDGHKIFNPGENFSINRHDTILSVEARDHTILTDTIFYQLANLRLEEYQFRFAPVNVPAQMQAWLVDAYTHAHHSVSLSDSTFINFTIGGDSASQASRRFFLVFKKAVTPEIISISAYDRSQSTQVDWKVALENQVQKYRIERSIDGITFNSIADKVAYANNGSTAFYTYDDAASGGNVSYYRVGGLLFSGQWFYSDIVKVEHAIHASTSVYPNPSNGNAFTLMLKDKPAGDYALVLTNSIGQLMHKQVFKVTRRKEEITIQPTAVMAAGSYTITVEGPGGTIVERLIVK